MTRRLRTIPLALAWLAIVSAVQGCGNDPSSAPDAEATRLHSRPGQPSEAAGHGKTSFNTEGASAMIYVPAGVQRDVPTPLVLFLHGANRTVEPFVDGHISAADAADAIVLAPYSTFGTWDAIQGPFSSDVRVIDEALAWTFQRWAIDPERIIISGFSDGATYALGIGRANGDLFRKIVAYSPGFLLDVVEVGKPPVLISHGTDDEVLPIDATSRRIVPLLRGAGYQVDFREFDGGHAVPLSVLEEVVHGLATTP